MDYSIPEPRHLPLLGTEKWEEVQKSLAQGTQGRVRSSLDVHGRWLSL